MYTFRLTALAAIFVLAVSQQFLRTLGSPLPTSSSLAPRIVGDVTISDISEADPAFVVGTNRNEGQDTKDDPHGIANELIPSVDTPNPIQYIDQLSKLRGMKLPLHLPFLWSNVSHSLLRNSESEEPSQQELLNIVSTLIEAQLAYLSSLSDLMNSPHAKTNGINGTMSSEETIGGILSGVTHAINFITKMVPTLVLTLLHGTDLDGNGLGLGLGGLGLKQSGDAK
ncbi:hypothetical protein AX16_003047 [Volvariella volvacea WC 439]|nr:hypothetical protein AX16_003047 [Volvariella volvacea WC 439]